LARYEQTKSNPAEKNLLKDYSFQSENGVDLTKIYIKINGNYNQTELAKLDAKVLVKTKSVVLISLPVTKIEEVAKLDFVEFVEISKPPKPLLDKALPSSNVDKVHQGINLKSEYFGEGVIVGVVDWGFDFTHPMFSDENGNSRVKYAWIDSRSIYTDSSIIKDSVKYSYRYHYHGTHVLGIAAGSEVKGQKSTYSGVASKSDIAVVELWGDINEALAYLFSYADSVGKPIVVNMSLSINDNIPFDGTHLSDLQTQELLNENPEGRILVAGVGNEGDINMHFENDFSQIQTVEGNLMLSAGFAAIGEVDNNFSITIYVRDIMLGKAITDSFTISTTDNIESNRIIYSIDDSSKRYRLILQTAESSSISNARPIIYVYLYRYSGNINYLEALRFKLSATSGKIHIWNLRRYEQINIITPFLQSDSRYTIFSPALIEEVIAVGAYVSKYASGPLAFFSSKGPLIDGRIKPDITAPGSVLYSAYNSYDISLSDDYRARFIVDKTQDNLYEFLAAQGTSMSTPMVTGIVALMLEVNPKLTQAEIKDILRITAINDEYTGNVRENKSPIWGWGKIDAHAIMRRLDGSNIDETKNAIPFSVYPNPVINNEITISIANTATENTISDLPFVVNIYDVAGKLVYLSSMQNEKTFDISRLESGFYIVKIDNGKQSSVQKIVVNK
jgi:subtilisin family serine protease